MKADVPGPNTLVRIRNAGQSDYTDYIDMIGVTIRQDNRLFAPGALVLIDNNIIYFDYSELEIVK